MRQYFLAAGNNTITGDWTETEKNLRRQLHATIQKVTADVGGRFNFNTAISSVMELVNVLYQYREELEQVRPDVI